MESWKLGLTINGRRYDHKELLAFSSDQIVSVINPWEKEIYRFLINWLSDNEQIVQYSSGTTGTPKEIRLSKISMMHSAQITCDCLKIGQGGTALLCMPVGFIAGKMMIVRCMVHNLNMVTVEPKSMPEIDPSVRIDLCAMVPLQAYNILMCIQSLSSIKKLLIGGAEISHELEQMLQEEGTEAWATYGMTETCSHIALRRINGSKPQKFYSALPGVALSLDSRECLAIEAPWLPEKVITNDLVELTGKGSFRWLGRVDNLINSGGYKIAPEEVEARVMEITGYACIATGLPDLKFGNRLVFVFEKNQLSGSLETLKDELQNVLPRRWKPKELYVVDKFPRNDSLKVDRRKLMDMIKADS